MMGRRKTTSREKNVQRWCRLKYQNEEFLGLDQDGQIELHQGSMLGSKTTTGTSVSPEQVDWLAPVDPPHFLALWNNFHERMQFEGTRHPGFPLYFTKLACSVAAHQHQVRRPTGFTGIVKFEAELGIVIGKNCFQVDEADVEDYIFGYTCVNDVTAPKELKENDEFHQWCRSKSFPGFGPIGPWIATGIDPEGLRVEAYLDGEKKQDYPVNDMIYSPREIVTKIAGEVELLAGDVIACGTSVGAETMQPEQLIEVNIEGIGRLSNRYIG